MFFQVEAVAFLEYSVISVEKGIEEQNTTNKQQIAENNQCQSTCRDHYMILSNQLLIILVVPINLTPFPASFKPFPNLSGITHTGKDFSCIAITCFGAVVSTKNRFYLQVTTVKSLPDRS